MILFTRNDPTTELVPFKSRSFGIFRRPNTSEIVFQYLYCFFVGMYAIRIDPYSFNGLLQSVFRAFFWMLAYLNAFYRPNILTKILSAVLTKVVWVDTFVAASAVVDKGHEMKHSILINFLILLSNIVIYTGMSYSSHIQIKSFDASCMILCTAIGGVVGMGIRMLYQFVGAPGLVYTSLIFFIVGSILPLGLLVWDRKKMRILKQMFIFCGALYVICLGMVCTFWLSGNGMSRVKECIFRAKNNDPIILDSIHESIYVDYKAQIFDAYLDFDPFQGGWPKIKKIFQWVLKKVLIPGIFLGIKIWLNTKSIFYPVYYEVLDKYDYSGMTRDIRSKSSAAHLASVCYAERDSVYGIWIYATVISTFVAVLYTLIPPSSVFRPIREVHEEVVDAMLEPEEECRKIDTDTYSRRIILKRKYLEELKMLKLKAPQLLTPSQSYLLHLARNK